MSIGYVEAKALGGYQLSSIERDLHGPAHVQRLEHISVPKRMVAEVPNIQHRPRVTDICSSVHGQ